MSRLFVRAGGMQVDVDVGKAEVSAGSFGLAEGSHQILVTNQQPPVRHYVMYPFAVELKQCP